MHKKIVQQLLGFCLRAQFSGQLEQLLASSTRNASPAAIFEHVVYSDDVWYRASSKEHYGPLQALSAVLWPVSARPARFRPLL